MRTIRIDGPRRCALADKPMPAIDRDYALLRVRVAPMCNEYLAYRDGIYLERNRPDSLGHEMAGEVVATRPGSRFDTGDRVVALCGYPCGHCVSCQDGYYAHCCAPDDPRQVCGSESGECGFAQYAIKPEHLLVPIPDDLSYEHASMICCGLGPTYGALQRTLLHPGDSVLITGLGAVGLGGVLNVKARGARAIGVSRSPYRAALAGELGCDAVVDPSATDAREAILDLTGGQGANAVLECSGQQPYQRIALECVARLGTVTFIAEGSFLPVHIDDHLVQKGVRLQGSLDINLRDAQRLLNVIRTVPGELDHYITHRLPLDRITDAFEAQIARECGKILLYPWPE
ncbi:zinc-binding dehydrogenase [Amycolatopsis sp. QT-25]|uniref:zinc-dependent alcohol dehydrogenase n=1 Tax=Amycolatopsis sp. QT-25 TaxID=3034022 RepID=UPI0023ED7ECA|nr:zinc-binding dehydrogenase [Amycolatopsis sp. QT-25]WET76258.1 zinc-binding dehydrogenase [Amycolatopsis sp. QT-25]